jgi:REP element-mobilizing transposase RayT
MSSDFHNRKKIRLKHYDYTQNGAYFVTICTENRQCLFGDVIDGKMALNDVGKMVENIWTHLPGYFSNIDMDTFAMMPNHFHGIIHILRRDGLPRPSNGPPCPSDNPKSRPSKPTPTEKMTLSDYMHRFKSFTTHSYRKQFSDQVLWQNGYYEHIIRNETNLMRIQEYILNNPAAWDDDDENPHRKKSTDGCPNLPDGRGSPSLRKK